MAAMNDDLQNATPAPVPEEQQIPIPQEPQAVQADAIGAAAPAEEPPAEEPPQAEATQQTEPAQAKEDGKKRAQAAWERLVAAKAANETVEGVVKAAVKGGLLVEVDRFRGFLPASQVRVDKGTALESLVKTTLPLKIIDVDEGRKRLVVSHRRAMEEQRRAARTNLLQSLKVGEERDATVVRLADFGAFVDLGGVDALIPMSELAFERVEKPSDVVHAGDKLKVRVLRIDQGGKKIAVSRKSALPDPWRDHAEVLRQGKVVEGKVVAKEPRLEVELAPGVVGSLGERDANPDDYAIGESVEVAVRSVDYRNRRIRLGSPHAASSFSSTGFAPLGVELQRGHGSKSE
jgi:small subunit ribosomal protein S1